MGEHRVLLASSPRWGYLPPAGRAMRERFDSHYRDAILVHRDRAGLERAAGFWWQDWGGRTELVVDLLAAVERVDEVWAWIYDRDPEPLAVWVRAEDLGVNGWVHYECPTNRNGRSRYPYRPGTPQYEGQHIEQIAARRRERNADARRRVRSSRQAG